MTAPDHSWKRRIPLAPRAPSIHDPHQKSVVQCNGFRLMCRNASRGIADHREAVVAQRNLGSAQAWSGEIRATPLVTLVDLRRFME